MRDLDVVLKDINRNTEQVKQLTGSLLEVVDNKSLEQLEVLTALSIHVLTEGYNLTQEAKQSVDTVKNYPQLCYLNMCLEANSKAIREQTNTLKKLMGR
jgi:hypothetical protein